MRSDSYSDSGPHRTDALVQRRGRRAPRLDEQLVEPARRGLRRFGVGMGTVASSAVIVGGAASSAFGGLLMGLATGFFAGLGAFFFAAGLTGIGLGAFGVWAVRKADRRASERAIERQLMKIVAAEGRVSDATLARRISATVEQVRASARLLARAGVLDIDVDLDTGEDVYSIEKPRQLTAASPDERELREFERRLETGGGAAGGDAAVQPGPAAAEMGAEVAVPAELAAEDGGTYRSK